MVRFAETRFGYGVKKANKTEIDLDFQLEFNATDRSLGVTFEYQPYAIYKPRISLTDLGIGLAAMGLLGKVYYDNWDHDYTFTFLDDRFDWYGSQPWEKAVMIGVPVDILLYWCFSYPFDRRSVKIQRQPLVGHPYRIELPDHGNIGRDYRTETGFERIEINDFLSEFKFLKDIESLKFRVSTEVSGTQYRRDYIVRGGFIPPPVPQVKIEAQWVADRLRSGEKAVLKVTVTNIDKNVLTELTVITDSPTPHFNNWMLKFSNIKQGASKTQALSCLTDPQMPPQEVLVFLIFDASKRIIHPEKIETKLHIIK